MCVIVLNNSLLIHYFNNAESRETKGTTEKSDIYGFGVLLIELLTGRSSSRTDELGVHKNIVEWARYCYSDCHLETWVDRSWPSSSASTAS